MISTHSIQKTMSLLLVAGVLSCSNNASDNKNEIKAGDKPAAETNTTASAATTTKANKNGATVDFTVNGVAAQTLPNGTKDTEEPLGLWNVTSNSLSLTLMGDDPKFPHRGSLIFGIDGFKAEPGTYTMGKACHASFSRYTTENAGGETQYSASPAGNYGTPAEKAESAKRQCTISFTKVEKQASEFGEKYVVSGTFSATLTLSLGFTNEVSQIDIANGKFENVPVSVLGKK